MRPKGKIRGDKTQSCCCLVWTLMFTGMDFSEFSLGSCACAAFRQQMAVTAW